MILVSTQELDNGLSSNVKLIDASWHFLSNRNAFKEYRKEHIENGFTNWDDPKYILDNHIIKDLSWERTQSIFLDKERKSGLYAPLTYLSWAVEFNYVRLDPYLYHLDNLLLHLQLHLLNARLFRSFYG